MEILVLMGELLLVTSYIAIVSVRLGLLERTVSLIYALLDLTKVHAKMEV